MFKSQVRSVPEHSKKTNLDTNDLDEIKQNINECN